MMTLKPSRRNLSLVLLVMFLNISPASLPIGLAQEETNYHYAEVDCAEIPFNDLDEAYAVIEPYPDQLETVLIYDVESLFFYL